TELDGRAQGVQHPDPIPEQGMGIQTTLSVAREDLVDESESVGAGDRPRVGVPHEQVQVESVEQIDVGAPAVACTAGAEVELAQPADLLESPGNLAGARAVDVEPAAIDEPSIRREGLDLGLERRPPNFIDHRSDSGGGRPAGAGEVRETMPAIKPLGSISSSPANPGRGIGGRSRPRALRRSAMEPLFPAPQAVAALPDERREDGQAAQEAGSG